VSKAKYAGDNEEPVTVIISRRVKPGRERDFERGLQVYKGTQLPAILVLT